MQSVNIAIADAFSPLFPCCSQGQSVSSTEEGDIGRKGRRRDFHNFFFCWRKGEGTKGEKAAESFIEYVFHHPSFFGL